MSQNSLCSLHCTLLDYSTQIQAQGFRNPYAGSAFIVHSEKFYSGFDVRVLSRYFPAIEEINYGHSGCSNGISYSVFPV